MRGRRRDRDKASDQEKHDSPVEVEPLSSDQSADGERTQVTNLADVAPDEPDGQIGQIISAAGSEGETVAAAGSESEPSKVRAAPVFEPPVAEARETEAETSSDGDSAPAARAENPSGTRAETTTSGRAEATTTAASVTTITAPPETTAPSDTTAPAAPRAATVDAETDSVAGTESGDLVDASPESASSGGEESQTASHLPLPRIIAVANQKGGVGKTTTAVNLGAALAELGFRVLVIDLDPQGNATTGLGVDARNFERSMYDVIMRDDPLEDCIEPTNMKNLFVAPATIDLAGAEIELVPAFSRELKLKRAIATVIDDFDYVLIDCPPSLGLITVNGLAAAAEVMVPIQCEYYALEGLSQLLRNVHLVASNLNDGLDVSTIVLTMYDARTKLSDQVASEVREHFGAKVCRNVIPRTVRLSEAPSFGQPISVFDPTSRGAIAYRELAKEVSGGAS